MKSLFSLREIAQELDIPKSTVVKYKDYFGEFLPLMGEGKRKKFDRLSLEIMQKIRDLREAQKLDWADIRSELKTHYGVRAVQEAGVATAVSGAGDAAYAPVRSEKARVVPIQSDSAKKLDYLVNLVYAFAGEMGELRKDMDALRRDAERAGSQVDPVLKKSLLIMHRHVQLLERSQKERERNAAALISDIARTVSLELSKIRAEVRQKSEPPAPAGPAPRPDLIEKLKRQQNVLVQVKDHLDHQVAKNEKIRSLAASIKGENEMLKGKNAILKKDVAVLKQRVAELERQKLASSPAKPAPRPAPEAPAPRAASPVAAPAGKASAGDRKAASPPKQERKRLFSFLHRGK